MLFAQFFQWSTGYIDGTIPPRFGPPSLIEATGDRSVLILDARVKPETNGRIAADECKRRDFVAWQIFSGASFLDCRPVSQKWYVNESQTVRNPSWLAAHGM